MPFADPEQNSTAPSAFAVGPQLVCFPITSTAIPATIAGSGNWQSGPLIGAGWKSIAVGATLSQTGTITIQRYLDAACTIPVGAPITVNLVASTPNWATVNDGVVWIGAIVTIANTSVSLGNLTKTAIVFGAS